MPPAPNPQTSATLLLILTHIDSHPSTITTKNEQLAYLTDLTSKYKLSYYSSGYGHSEHDAASLRKSIGIAVRKGLKPGTNIRVDRTAVDEFFERGEQVLDDGYVQAVKQAANGMRLERRDGREDGETSEEEGAGGGEEEVDEEQVPPILETASMAGDDEEYIPEGGQRSKKQAKKTSVSKTKRARSRSSSVSLPPTEVPDEEGPMLQHRDRISPGIEESEKQARKGTIPSSNKTKRARSQSASVSQPLTEDSDLEDQMQTGDIATPSEEESEEKDAVSLVSRGSDSTTAAQTSFQNKRKTSVTSESDEDTPPRRVSKMPKRLPQESVTRGRSSGSGSEGSGSETPESRDGQYSRHSKPEEEELREVEDTDSSNPDEVTQLREGLERLADMIQVVVEAFFDALGHNATETADLVISPSPDLARLYAEVLGTTHWKATAAELQARNSLPADDFVRALIAKFLMRSIMEAKLPWKSPLALMDDNTPFRRYVLPQLYQEHADANVDSLFVEAAKAQLQDETFLAETLKPEARAKATELRLTLNKHIHLLAPSDQDESEVDSDWHETICSNLEAICEAALVFRGHIAVAAVDAEIEWFWYGTRESFAGKMRSVKNDGAKNGGYVAFTIFPGFEIHRRGDEGGIQLVSWPANVARVRR